jgi:hypothetical protein
LVWASAEEVMFEKNEELDRAADVVYGLFRELKRGDILTHKDIGEALNYLPLESPTTCRERSRWDQIVWKARHRLQRETGIACWTEEGVGYKLLTPAEQIESALWHNEKAQRSAGRGKRNVADVPDKLLSAHMRRMKQFVHDRAVETRRALLNATRVIRQQLKPRPPLPPRFRAEPHEDRPRA